MEGEAGAREGKREVGKEKKEHETSEKMMTLVVDGNVVVHCVVVVGCCAGSTATPVPISVQYSITFLPTDDVHVFLFLFCGQPLTITCTRR